MTSNRIALVTGGNQGVGRHVANELSGSGFTVYLGSRDLGRGEAAAKAIGGQAVALQLDVTDRASITAAAARIAAEQGRLDVLVNNAGISNTSGLGLGTPEYRASAMASTASLDEVRAVWETNVFGALAVYQAMLPLLRASGDARVVNVSSGLGSLSLNANPSSPYHAMFGPIYAASKTALNAMSLAMTIELENTPIKVNVVSPEYTATGLNGFAGTSSVEEGSREVVRLSLAGPEVPGGTFTRLGGETIPW